MENSEVTDLGADHAQMPKWVPRAIVLFFATGAGVVAGYWFIVQIRSLLIVLLISLFLAFALEPAVNALASRGLRRGAALALVALGILGLVGAFVFAMGSLLVDQVQKLIDDAPEHIQSAEKWINQSFDAKVNFDDLIEKFKEGGSAEEWAAKMAPQALDIGAAVIGVIFQLLTISLFTFYFVVDGPRLRRSICTRLPEQRQREVLRIWEIAIDKTGGYIYSRSLLAVFSMIAHWVVFTIIGLDYALPLAIWVGLLSQFIPVVGTYLAGVLPILIALVGGDLIQALFVLTMVVVYQQIENYLLAPRITAQTMAMHPAVAFASVIIGASILGPVGALLALPAAATLQAFVSTSMKSHAVVESALTATHSKRKQRAATGRRWGRTLGSELPTTADSAESFDLSSDSETPS